MVQSVPYFDGRVMRRSLAGYHLLFGYLPSLRSSRGTSLHTVLGLKESNDILL